MRFRGFTLIELALVLAVIAIISLAGILSIDRVIRSMRTKDVIAIIEDMRTATTYFKKRYNYLPGDWPYTAGEIPNVGSSPGNGDGKIDGAINTKGEAEVGSEVAEAPWQLFNAGFIGRIDAHDPQKRIKTTLGTVVHIVSADVANALVPGFAQENPTVINTIVFFNLPCDIVNELDSEIDDGNPSTGRAMGTACADSRVMWYAVNL
jgi:prepilin-type N-terminal cleavage/methylation domain-containing protein